MQYRPLMVPGSGYEAGKSIMVAGFCRIFRQAGIRVAPAGATAAELREQMLRRRIVIRDASKIRRL